MTKTQQRQMAKGRAFNQLLKLYHPKAKWRSSGYEHDDMTYREIKEYQVQEIFDEYFKTLKKINYGNSD